MRKSILLTEDNDLQISPVRENGLIVSGLVIDESDRQSIDLIVEAAKGEFKEFPYLGCSLINYLKSVGREREMIREVTVQLELDGYNPTVTYNNGNLGIDY
jgi:hypothetical protein